MNKTEARERLERLLAVVDELPEEAEILLLEGCSPGDTGDGRRSCCSGGSLRCARPGKSGRGGCGRSTG